MLFWGWGGSTVNRQISPTQAVILAYRYIHVMFAFTATRRYTYLLATLTPQGWANQPITKEQALQLLGGAPLEPSWWKRYSLWLLLGLTAAIIVGSIVGSAVRHR